MMIDPVNSDEDNTILTTDPGQELIRFMTDWGNISGLRDAAVLDEMLPDDLIITMADSTVMTKAEYLDGFKNIPADFIIIDYDQQAQIFDHAAIVRARCVLEMNGSETHLRYTATFIKRGGKWDVVALHSSPLANN
jgi:hypothetical protein